MWRIAARLSSSAVNASGHRQQPAAATAAAAAATSSMVARSCAASTSTFIANSAVLRASASSSSSAAVSSPFLRSLHSARACLSDSDEAAAAAAAKIAAHREMMIKRKAEIKAASEAAAMNPQPATDEPAPAGAPGDIRTAIPGTLGAMTKPVSSAPFPKRGEEHPDPSTRLKQVEVIEQHKKLKKSVAERLKQEWTNLKAHYDKRWAPAPQTNKKAAVKRPTIAPSRIPVRDWNPDPIEEAAARAAEEKEKAKNAPPGEASAEEPAVEEIKEETPYTGSTEIVLDPKLEETVWDKRLGAFREKLRFISSVAPKRALKTVTSKSETLTQLTQEVSDSLEEAKESWETSQDPRVWRMRDMVDKVVGETETGAAMGEIMASDPSWNYLTFLRDMEETMIPEVTKAFRIGDMKLLQSVCEGQASRAMLASFQERAAKGEDYDEKILDIRGVDIVKASLHQDQPYIILTFVVQHVAQVYKPRSEAEIAAGVKREMKIDPTTGKVKDDRSTVQNTYYSWAIRRDYESQYYDWKIFEFHSQHVQALV